MDAHLVLQQHRRLRSIRSKTAHRHVPAARRHLRQFTFDDREGRQELPARKILPIVRCSSVRARPCTI